MLKIYNTLTRKKEIFKSSRRRIKMFVCGPTVYDFSHIGHARTYIAFDSIVRYLRYAGFKVFYLQNITDIDDKIIERAKKENSRPRDLAKKFEKEYLKDIKSLGIKSVDKYAGAANHIKEIVSQIERLIKNGYAYKIEGDGYYFNISKFNEYGKLSKRTAKQAQDAVSRIDESVKKKNKGDFALWKFSKPDEPFWKTKLGNGRPGWHIEDTAIAERYFGLNYDLHGGAIDLIFPHHESEIAQAEGISGKKPFVKIWMHTGFLLVNGEKMSKSLGNFITIRDLLKNHSAEAFRLLVLTHNYRSPIDYSEELIKQNEASLERINEFLNNLKKIRNQKSGAKNQQIKKIVLKSKSDFFKWLDDDFNTPRAIAALFDLIRKINPIIDKLDKNETKSILDLFNEADKILGIIPKKIVSKNIGKIPKIVLELVKEREKLRRNKKFEEADKIRESIKNLGYEIKDSSKGPILKLVKTEKLRGADF